MGAAKARNAGQFASLAAICLALTACATTGSTEAGGPADAAAFAGCDVYDSHAHLISDDPVRYPRNEMSMEPRAADTLFRPGTVGEPGGMHGPNPVNEKPTAEQLYSWMSQERVCAISAVQKGMIYRTDNRYIVDAADKYPHRMTAVIIVDPQAPETPDMIRQYAGRGVVGIRFFGVGIGDKVEWLGSPESLKVWDLANELGLVVDIEAPSSQADLLIPLITRMADRYPNMPIVLDHVYLPDPRKPDFGIDDSFAPFVARKNIYVKFTNLNMDVIREQGIAPARVLRRVVDVFGADRVMWGSDIGTSSGTYRELVARGRASTALLNDAERRKVLHDTGRRIFDRPRG